MSTKPFSHRWLKVLNILFFIVSCFLFLGVIVYWFGWFSSPTLDRYLLAQYYYRQAFSLPAGDMRSRMQAIGDAIRRGETTYTYTTDTLPLPPSQ